MPQSLITAKYQTTVPKEVRQRLDLRSGDVLRWEVVGDDIRVVPARRGFLERRGSLHVGPGSAAEDVREMRRRRGTEVGRSSWSCGRSAFRTSPTPSSPP